jgi:hypothetical protein
MLWFHHPSSSQETSPLVNDGRARKAPGDVPKMVHRLSHGTQRCWCFSQSKASLWLFTCELAAAKDRSGAHSIDRSWATRTFIKIQNNIWVIMGKLEVHDGSTLVTEMQKSVFMKFVEQIHNAHIAK